MDDRFHVETPENVTFGYSVAGLGSRFLAALIDHAILIALLLVAALVSALADLADAASQAGNWFGALVGLIAFGLYSGYFIVAEILTNGQSPGKKLVGLRVVKTNGTPINFVDSVIRNLVRFVDFLPSLYALGMVVMFFHEQARRLGDFAAGTVVIREQREVTLDSLTDGEQRTLDHRRRQHRDLQSGDEPAGASVQADELPAGYDLPVQRLTLDDYDLMVQYLKRRRQLPNAGAVAVQIAQGVANRMGLNYGTPPTPAQAEVFIQMVVDAQRHRADALAEGADRTAGE